MLSLVGRRERVHGGHAVDWKRFVELALRSGLPGLVGERLGADAPLSVRRALLMASLAVEANVGELLASTDTILDRAEQLGLKLIPFKGSALMLAGIYAPGERAMVDIDLLSHPSQLDDVAALLVALGFRSERAALPQRHHHHVRFVSERNVLVELHWTCFYRMYDGRGKGAEALGRAVRGAAGHWRLAAEDEVLSLALHLASHRFRGLLKWPLDLIRLAEAREALDWQRVVGLSASLGARRAVQYALWHASMLMGVQPPMNVRLSRGTLALLTLLNPPFDIVEGALHPPAMMRPLVDALTHDDIGHASRDVVQRLVKSLEEHSPIRVPSCLLLGGYDRARRAGL
ncbi:MAG: nucleotidyltransferase family protein [Myxococcales bacterium]|nr:nucleotidyltransferase family protein [Myxococcales bacterium]